jgi:hypothetical protein
MYVSSVKPSGVSNVCAKNLSGRNLYKHCSLSLCLYSFVLKSSSLYVCTTVFSGKDTIGLHVPGPASTDKVWDQDGSKHYIGLFFCSKK